MVEVKKLKSEALFRSYEVTVPANDFDVKLNERLSQLRKTLKVPGFRPGKVPMEMVKKRYSENVKPEVLELVIDDAAKTTLKNENLRPAWKPKIEIKDFEDGKDLSFSLELEVMPNIAEVNIEELEFEKPTSSIEDKHIISACQRIAETRPYFVDIKEARPAKEGDAVVIDFKGKVDGNFFDGGSATGHQLELGSKRFIEGFEEQLIGKNQGDEILVKTTFPEKYHSKDLAGKPVEFEVKIHKIQEKAEAGITDEFAKYLGLENIDALKNTIEQQLSNEIASMSRTLSKKMLFDKLDKQLDFELPKELVKKEFESIWKQVEAALKDEEGKKEFEGKTEDQIREEYQKLSQRRVKLGIFLADIADKENLDVGQEEINRALIGEAMQYPGEEKKVIDFYRSNPEYMETFRGPILEEKAVNLIFEKAKSVEKKYDFDELKEKIENMDV